MPNTNFNTIIQMPSIVNDFVKQSMGRESVSRIDMDFVTVAQDKQKVLHEIDFDDAASFVNNNELPMSIIVKIAAVQSGSGTPSSENTRLITGWTGVNVWDDPKYDKPIVWNQLLEHGDFDSDSGWSGSPISVSNGIATISHLATATYNSNLYRSVSCDEGDIYLIMTRYKCTADNNIRCRYPFIGTAKNTTANKWQDFAWIGTAGSSQTNIGVQTNSIENETSSYDYMMAFNLTLMFGSTIAAYINTLETTTPGAGVAYFKSLFYKDYYDYDTGTVTCVSEVNDDYCRSESVTFPDPPETVYGGSLNLTTGILTVTHGYVDLGDLTWTKDTVSGETVFIAALSGGPELASFSAICSNYPMDNDEDYTTDASGRCFGDSTLHTSSVGIRDDTYAEGDAAAFKTAMDGVQLVYPLKTPVTYEMDPEEVKALIGQNNVFADTGDVAVSYTSYIPVP